jgi:hypothetical protein
VRECTCAKTLLEPLPLHWLPLAIRDHGTRHYADKIAAAADAADEDDATDSAAGPPKAQPAAG